MHAHSIFNEESIFHLVVQYLAFHGCEETYERDQNREEKNINLWKNFLISTINVNKA